MNIIKVRQPELVMGNQNWLWATRTGYGQPELVMGNQNWLWATRTGYGQPELVIGNQRSDHTTRENGLIQFPTHLHSSEHVIPLTIHVQIFLTQDLHLHGKGILSGASYWIEINVIAIAFWI